MDDEYIKRKIMGKKLHVSLNTNNKNYDAYFKLQTISLNCQK